MVRDAPLEIHHPQFRKNNYYFCISFLTNRFFTNFTLLFITISYLLCGGIIFRFFSSHENFQDIPENFKNECLHELWNITERMHVLYEKNWTSSVLKKLETFEANIIRKIIIEKKKGQRMKIIRTSGQSDWSLSAAIFYSFTLLTTIGNDNLYLTSDIGKIATLLYAVFGLPLTFLCISNFGLLLVNGMQYVHTNGAEAQNSEFTYCPRKICRKYDCERNKKKPLVNKKDMLVQVSNNRRKNHFFSNSSKLEIENIIIERSSSNSVADQSAGAIKYCKSSCNYNNGQKYGANKCPFVGVNPDLQYEICYDKRTKTATIKECDRNTQSVKSLFDAKGNCKSRIFLKNSSLQILINTMMFSIALVAYICLGATAFSIWHAKNFFQGIYFTFANLLTIGASTNEFFGNNSLDITAAQCFLHCLYFSFGLIIVSVGFRLFCVLARNISICSYKFQFLHF